MIVRYKSTLDWIYIFWIINRKQLSQSVRNAILSFLTQHPQELNPFLLPYFFPSYPHQHQTNLTNLVNNFIAFASFFSFHTTHMSSCSPVFFGFLECVWGEQQETGLIKQKTGMIFFSLSKTKDYDNKFLEKSARCFPFCSFHFSRVFQFFSKYHCLIDLGLLPWWNFSEKWIHARLLHCHYCLND